MCDVILVADSGFDSLSATNPLRLDLDGHPANIQVVRNFVENGGKVVPPVIGDGECSWESTPKLNGIYLYNYLAKQGFEVALVNNYQKERDLFLALAENNPKVVAVSTTYMIQRKTVHELVAEIKELCPEAVVIVGGPFVNTSWRIRQEAEQNPLYDLEEIRKQFLFFDSAGDQADLYIISSHGENLLCDAIRHIMEGNMSWRELPNTASVKGGQYVFSQRDDRSNGEDITIDWAELPESLFSKGVVPIRASVGCPYSCNFCSFNKESQPLHVKPIDQLVAELKAVQERGVKYVWFVDDNFRLGKRDVEDVCRRFIEEGITLQWMTLIRPETLKDVNLDLLKRAGCREVQMGLESADPKVLANMNKQSDPVLNEGVIKRLMTAGINCACYFIFGYPGETDESIARTVSFIKRLEEHDGNGFFYWSLFPFILSPFSPIFDSREDYDLEGYFATWSHKTMCSDKVNKFLVKAFMALDNSCPIYRGDNLDQVSELAGQHGRQFLKTRHDLEKLKVSSRLTGDVAYKAFVPLFK